MLALIRSPAMLKYKVKRLVFTHIGRPTIRAIDAGERPVFGEFAADGDVYSCSS